MAETAATAAGADEYIAAGTVRALTVLRRLGDFEPERWERTITADVEFLKHAKRELEAIGYTVQMLRVSSDVLSSSPDLESALERGRFARDCLERAGGTLFGLGASSAPWVLAPGALARLTSELGCCLSFDWGYCREGTRPLGNRGHLRHARFGDPRGALSGAEAVAGAAGAVAVAGADADAGTAIAPQVAPAVAEGGAKGAEASGMEEDEPGARPGDETAGRPSKPPAAAPSTLSLSFMASATSMADLSLSTAGTGGSAPAAVPATTEAACSALAAVPATTEAGGSALAAVPATTEAACSAPAAVPATTEAACSAPAAVPATTEAGGSAPAILPPPLFSASPYEHVPTPLELAAAVQDLGARTGGQGSFFFTVSCGVPDSATPFFAGSALPRALDAPALGVGMETNRLLEMAIRLWQNGELPGGAAGEPGKAEGAVPSPRTMDALATTIAEVWTRALQPLERRLRSVVCPSASASAPRYDYLGVDTSINPSLTGPDLDAAYAAVLAPLGSRLGGPGSLLATEAMTRGVRGARVAQTGYRGVMLAVAEDPGLARAASEGRLDVERLAAYSAVCGVGIDTVPVPGIRLDDLESDAASPERAACVRAALPSPRSERILAATAAHLADLAAVSARLDKPLSCRLLPIAGGRPGETAKFPGIPHLIETPILTLDRTANREDDI